MITEGSEINSAWYQGILTRTIQHRQNNRNKKVAQIQNTTKAEDNQDKRAMTQEHRKPSESKTKTSSLKCYIGKTESKAHNQHSITKAKATIGQPLSNQLKQVSTKSTMTTFSKPSVTTHAVAATFLAIANQVSNKVSEKTIQNGKKQDKNDGNGWSTVPSKKDQTKQPAPKPIHLLPKVLPTPAERRPIVYSSTETEKKITPICIRLKKNRFSNGTFDTRRTIQAILIALQNVDQSTSIRPINETEHPPINDPENIPTEKETLLPYHENCNDPEQSPNLLVMKLRIESFIGFYKFKKNSVLTEWMRSENIQFERNTLNEMKPQQAGYLIHHMVRPEIIDVYETRFKQLMSITCPEFMLQPKTLVCNYATTNVWNVMTAPEHITAIVKEFKNLNTTELRQFVSWKEQNAIQPDQQLKLAQLNNTFQTEYRSLVMTGFHDHPTTMMFIDDLEIEEVLDESNNIIRYKFTESYDQSMQDECIESRFYQDINLKTTTVNEFIQQAFISGDTTPVFGHVFDTLYGTKEVLVPVHHIAEAIDLIKVIKYELSRIMNNQAMEQTFNIQADQLLMEAQDVDPWEPLNIQTEIEGADTGGLSQTPQQAKRRRTKQYTGHNRVNNNNRSYADIARGNRNRVQNNNLSMHRHASPTASTNGSSDITHHESVSTEQHEILQNFMSELKSELHTELNNIKTTVHQMDNKVQNIDKSITNMDNRINDVQTTTNNSLAKLEYDTTERLTKIQEDNKQSIDNLSNLFTTTTTQYKSSTESFMQQLLQQQEERISNNFRESIQSLHSDKQQPPSPDHMRARKKPTRSNSQSMDEDEQQDDEQENAPLTQPSTTETTPRPGNQTSIQQYLNPLQCLKNMQQHPTLRYRSGAPLPNKLK